MIDYENFRKALKNLEGFWEIYQNAEDVLVTPEQAQLNKMGIVKGFEICEQEAYGALRRHLFEVLSIPKAQGNLFDIAHKYELLNSSPQQWKKYVDTRNMSSHEYGEIKADKIIAIIDDFIADCIDLYETVTGEKWK